MTVFQLRSGGEVAVGPGDPQIAEAEWLVVVDLDGGDRARVDGSTWVRSSRRRR